MYTEDFAIIRFKGFDYLCYNDGSGDFTYVANPMMVFTPAEDGSEIIRPDTELMKKRFNFRGKNLKLVVCFYKNNNWPALVLVNEADDDVFAILTVNLEHIPAFDIPDKAFIDTNNYPDAVSFLTDNLLGKDIGYKRSSGYVEYPMFELNLSYLYQISPEQFRKEN